MVDDSIVTTRTESADSRGSVLFGRDARIALAMIGACFALVLGLRFVSRDAPSAGRSAVVSIPTPVVSSDDGCGNFASFWMDEAGTGASAGIIEGISNCRQAADGSWFVPKGSDDPRLTTAPVLTDQQATATEALRQELMAEINNLEATFPSTLQRWLNQLYDPVPRAAVGNIRDGYSIRTARGRYTRLTQAFLLAPKNRALADYVGWIMATRIKAYDTLQVTCKGEADLEYLRTACSGLADNLSIRYPPFPWDLRNELTMDEYLAYTLTAPPSSTPIAHIVSVGVPR